MPAATTHIDLPVNCSGQWTGFFNAGSPASRRRLDVLLQFRESQVSGVGDDDAGMFVLSGKYDVAAQEFRWVQTYPFGDTIFCRGFCDANTLWGTWQDAAEGHGGFQIWPLGASTMTTDGRALAAGHNRREELR